MNTFIAVIVLFWTALLASVANAGSCPRGGCPHHQARASQRFAYRAGRSSPRAYSYSRSHSHSRTRGHHHQ